MPPHSKHALIQKLPFPVENIPPQKTAEKHRPIQKISIPPKSIGNRWSYSFQLLRCHRRKCWEHCHGGRQNSIKTELANIWWSRRRLKQHHEAKRAQNRYMCSGWRESIAVPSSLTANKDISIQITSRNNRKHPQLIPLICWQLRNHRSIDRVTSSEISVDFITFFPRKMSINKDCSNVIQTRSNHGQYRKSKRTARFKSFWRIGYGHVSESFWFKYFFRLNSRSIMAHGKFDSVFSLFLAF